MVTFLNNKIGHYLNEPQLISVQISWLLIVIRKEHKSWRGKFFTIVNVQVSMFGNTKMNLFHLITEELHYKCFLYFLFKYTILLEKFSLLSHAVKTK
jgi:hypothetical protein